MERNDSTPSAGEAPNAEASKSRGGGGRKRLASGLAFLAAFACFTFVGIQGVTAEPAITTVGANWDPTTGNHDYQGGALPAGTNEEFGVIFGTGPACGQTYTMVEADHVEKGSPVGVPAQTTVQGALAFAHGVGRWDNARTFVKTKSKLEAQPITGEGSIGYDVHYNQPLDNDTWTWDTTGTCLNCIPGTKGFGKYWVKCKTIFKANFSWELHEDIPAQTKDTATLGVDAFMQDHNNKGHSLVLSLTPKQGTSDSKSYDREFDSHKYFELVIDAQDDVVGKAWGSFTSTGTLTKDSLGVSSITLGEAAGVTDEAETWVSHLWMVPVCFDDATGDQVATTGTTNIGIIDRELFRAAREAANLIGDCIVHTTPESMVSGIMPIESGSAAIPSGQLGGYTSGEISVEEFSDGSSRAVRTYHKQNECKVCIVIRDQCERTVFSCCKTVTRTTDSEGNVTVEESSDCEGEEWEPEACELN